VIGLDGHDRDIFDEVTEFVMASRLHEVQVTLPTPFPGTPFYERLQKEGRLADQPDWKKLTLFDLTFEPARMTFEELTSGFRQLVTELYSDECVRARRKAFKDCIRRGRREYRGSNKPRQVS
jgi:hypothetical protein